MVKKYVALASVSGWNGILNFLSESVSGFLPYKIATQELFGACEEIFVNISSYAYDGAEGEVEILLEVIPEKEVRVKFIDSGKYFDPTKVSDPNTKSGAKERKIGGLGIFVAKKMSDKMEYERKEGKNILTITKFKR